MIKFKTNEKYDRFKRQLLEWKKTHIEEYLDFAERMNCDSKTGLSDIAKILFFYLPSFAKAWSICWRDDSDCDFSELNSKVFKSGIISRWIGDIEKDDCQDHIGPLVLCWIVYGQCFETVVRQMQSLLDSGNAGPIGRRLYAAIIKSAINTSINGGYRTRQNWDDYFRLEADYRQGRVAEGIWEGIREEEPENNDRMLLEEAIRTLARLQKEKQEDAEAIARLESDLETMRLQTDKKPGRKKAKELPLSEYLTKDDKPAIISIIGEFIEQNNEANHIALTYMALKNLKAINGIASNKEYYTAIVMQYQEIQGIKSESACVHALGDVQKVQKIYINGKPCDGYLNEDDKYRPLYDALVEKLKSVI